MVSVADGGWWGGGRDGVVVFLDVVDRGHKLVGLGLEGSVEAGEELLGGDEAQRLARGRDGDWSGDLRDRHYACVVFVCVCVCVCVCMLVR